MTISWSNDLLVAICGTPDQPLKIGETELQCYVLEDERRVLVQNTVLDALEISHGGSGGTGGDRLAKFTHGARLSDYVTTQLLDGTAKPIKFKTPKGSMAYGYEATILADICEAVLAARKDNKLQKQQMHIAEQCEILMRGFARVGIIALVDEVTGYQEIRAANSLTKILEAFVAKELQPYVQTFCSKAESPKPEYRASTACSSGVACLYSLSSCLSVRMAARLASKRTAAPAL